jgi:mannosylfructose-phosphate synthase
MVKVFRHDRLRGRMGRMGAHKARSLFTWTGIAQQLVAVVEKRETDTLIFHDTVWDDPWEDSD